MNLASTYSFFVTLLQLYQVFCSSLNLFFLQRFRFVIPFAWNILCPGLHVECHLLFFKSVFKSCLLSYQGLKEGTVGSSYLIGTEYFTGVRKILNLQSGGGGGGGYTTF